MSKSTPYQDYIKRSSKKESNEQSSNNTLPQKDLNSEDDFIVIGPSIKNQFGEQNCFLNVLIHTAYNIKEIRNFFRGEEFRKEPRLNIYLEFKKYWKIKTSNCKSNDNTLDPFELRREIALLFEEEQKFQVNTMNDPVDLFLLILNSFHSYANNAKCLKYVVEKPCNPQCLSHSLFWINILEQHQCLCGATSEVLQYDYNYFMYEVYVEEIFKFANQKEDLDKILFKISNTSMSCPEKCRKNKVTRNFFLLSEPTYLCFNLIWTGKNPKLLDIFKLFTMLPTTFKNDDLFNIADKAQLKTYELFGFICYWSGHYICFFKSQQGNHWLYYDDTLVTKIDSWRDVILKCLKSHFHPTILFYKKVDENEQENWRRRDTRDPLFSDEEKSKLKAYCEEIDHMNDKKSDYVNLKESENITNVKEHDTLSTSKIKTTNIKLKTSEENLKLEPNDCEKLNIPKVVNVPKIIENKEKIKIDKEVRPAEDEWICQTEKCRNVNKINTYLCLSKLNFNVIECKDWNENIYELNRQKKEYESKLNKSIRRTSSLDHVRISERSSTKMLNTNNEIKIQENNIKPINNVNRASSQSIRQSASVKCDICRESSHARMSCDHLTKKNDKLSLLEKTKQLLAGKLAEADDISNRLNSNSKNVNYSTPSFTFDSNKSHLSRMITPWTCLYCNNFNKNYDNLCDKCCKDRNYSGRDGLRKSVKDLPAGNSQNNYNGYNPSLRGNTPLKKSDTDKVNHKIKDETRNLNGNTTGPNQVGRIINVNEYKPTIVKQNTHKNSNLFCSVKTSNPVSKTSSTQNNRNFFK